MYRILERHYNKAHKTRPNLTEYASLGPKLKNKFTSKQTNVFPHFARCSNCTLRRSNKAQKQAFLVALQDLALKGTSSSKVIFHDYLRWNTLATTPSEVHCLTCESRRSVLPHSKQKIPKGVQGKGVSINEPPPLRRKIRRTGRPTGFLRASCACTNLTSSRPTRRGHNLPFLRESWLWVKLQPTSGLSPSL